MGFEGSVTKIADLNSLWPLASDERSYGDDHIRAVKAALRSLIDGVWPAGLVQLGFAESLPAGNLLKVNASGNGIDSIAQSTFAVAAKGVTNGDSHDHSGGDGAQIDHASLANKGTNTHAQIDAHIASTSNPHTVTANQVLPSQSGNSGKFLTTDGSTASWGSVAASGGLNGIQVFTANGTWTKPEGVTKIYVEVVGHGGSGGPGNTSPQSRGGGGGAGGYAAKLIDVTGVSSVVVTIGSAVTNTSFGAYCQATPGQAGSAQNGGEGGIGSGGDINARGCTGEYILYVSGSAPRGGAGGASFFGGGGAGAISSTPATDGTCGGGGGGGNEVAIVGGYGGNGLVRVWEFK